MPRLGRAKILIALALCNCFYVLFILLLGRTRSNPKVDFPSSSEDESITQDTPVADSNAASSRDEVEVDVVVASLAKENTSWLHEYFPQWRKQIYIVNDPAAPLAVPQNKGRESMAYLTYVPCQIYHPANRRQSKDNP